MEINFELYKVFYSVAKYLSFSKASKVLFISQSAVSQHIRQLETKLDTTLFNRSTKQVTLTTEGIKFLEYIEPAVHMILNGESYLKELKTLKKGQLHIGASDTICKHYLLKYFKLYHTRYPHIEIKVTNRTSIECVKLLSNSLVDLIVTNLPNHHIYDDMTITKTLSFQDVFIASPTLNINSSACTLQSLSKHKILMLEKTTTTSEYLYELFEAKDLDIHASIELGNIDLLIELTKIGLGISFVPDFCIPTQSDIQIIRPTDIIPKRYLGIVTHEKRPLSEATKQFITLLTATL